jgi:hypothetical protein
MKSTRFRIGDTVTIPNGHGRESGQTGQVCAIEQNMIGWFYQVSVPSPRSPAGAVQVPVLVTVLDVLSPHPDSPVEAAIRGQH